MSRVLIDSQSTVSLSREARQEGEVLARRLQAELDGILRGLEDPTIGPRPAARLFDVDFGLCQRVLAVARAPESGLDSLTKLPGPIGLRAVVESILRVQRLRPERHPVIGAVDAFADYIRRNGPSHAKLIERITSTTIKAAADEDPKKQSRKMTRARKGMMEHAATLTGSTTEWELRVAAIRPMADAPGLIESITLQAYMGLFSSTGRTTIVQRSAYSKSDKPSPTERVCYEPLGVPAGDCSSGVLEEFTTRPMPISGIERHQDQMRMVLDLSPSGGTADLVLASRWRGGEDPRTSVSRNWTHTGGVLRPSRRFVKDVYVHKDLAQLTRVDGGAMWYRPGITGSLREEWERQVPGDLVVERADDWLKSDTKNGGDGKAWHPGVLPMVCRLFELAGWNPREFVRYRIDHEYPYWGSLYWTTFYYQGPLTVPQ